MTTGYHGRLQQATIALKDYVAGMHIWNFADFKTGQGTRRVGGLNLKGVFTRDRRLQSMVTLNQTADAEWASQR